MKQPDPTIAIAKSFSKHAESYEQHALLQKDMAEQLTRFLPPSIPASVLEIGCGTGLFTQKLIGANIAQLYLNDISPQMLTRLKSSLALPSNTKLYCGDACQLDFPSSDLIAANAVFQWFENPQDLVRRLKQFLNPEGHLIFSVFGPETLKEFRRIARIDGPISLYSLEQWILWLKNAGFVVKQSEKEIRKTHWSDTRSLMKNLQQVGAVPIRKLSYREVKRLISDYENSFATVDGVSSEWEIFYFSAVLI